MARDGTVTRVRFPPGSVLLSTMRVCDARGGNDSIEHSCSSVDWEIDQLADTIRDVPSAWEIYPTITESSQAASDHAAVFIDINI